MQTSASGFPTKLQGFTRSEAKSRTNKPHDCLHFRAVQRRACIKVQQLDAQAVTPPRLVGRRATRPLPPSPRCRRKLVTGGPTSQL
ncbi:hypothetical protein E2C01_058489 [Portunus trituberculatus]|uniref:Uncharacterized protein n=1 Tax=Portunus trituberculatus TaxID=210409 RepID=A0A5B7H3W2_PORTR|nr:hypothetical protein [Portunus trituberculatus]